MKICLHIRPNVDTELNLMYTITTAIEIKLHQRFDFWSSLGAQHTVGKGKYLASSGIGPTCFSLYSALHVLHLLKRRFKPRISTSLHARPRSTITMMLHFSILVAIIGNYRRRYSGNPAPQAKSFHDL